MRIDDNGRKCTVCHTYLPWTSFNKNSNSRHGHDNRCRTCLKEYRQSNTYKDANKLRSQRDYADPSKKDQQKARMRAYRRSPAFITNYPNFRAKHRDYQRTYSKKWREEHPERSRKTARKRMKKWLSNPRNRLSSAMSASIRHYLSNGTKNRRHWETLMPYTLDALKSHLESLWEPGMSWSNHTVKGWHIDHIQPVASFTFTSPEDQGFKDCWSLSNLMPRWSTTGIAIRYGSTRIGNTNKGHRPLAAIPPLPPQ